MASSRPMKNNLVRLLRDIRTQPIKASYRRARIGDHHAPVPDKATVCGLLLALSVIERLPVLWPVAVGVNLTAIVQLEPADKLLVLLQVVVAVLIANWLETLKPLNTRLARLPLGLVIMML